MQGSLHFVLPGKRVDELMQPDRHFEIGQGLAFVVEQLQVRDKPKRIGHRHDATLQLDPVPGDARGLGFPLVAPECLTSAKGCVIAEAQHPGTKMREVQLRRAASLPQ